MNTLRLQSLENKHRPAISWMAEGQPVLTPSFSYDINCGESPG